MHQVEGTVRGRILGHVVLPHFDIGCVQRGRPRHVEVGGQHVPGRSDPGRQVVEHRGPARPHLPDPPPGGQAEAVEVAERRGVEEEGEGLEAVHRLGGVVGEEVAVGRRGPGRAHGSAGSGDDEKETAGSGAAGTGPAGGGGGLTGGRPKS